MNVSLFDEPIFVFRQWWQLLLWWLLQYTAFVGGVGGDSGGCLYSGIDRFGSDGLFGNRAGCQRLDA